MPTINEVTKNFDRLADAFHVVTNNMSKSSGPFNNSVIAFSGLAGSGKDSAGEALLSTPLFNRVSFADPIRIMLTAIGVPVSEIYEGTSKFGKEDPIPEFCGSSLRKLMQTLGTEWGRDQISPDFWVQLAQIQIKRNQAQRRYTVITDLRFDNEAKMIKDNGGVIIHIKANGKKLEGDTYKHASEQGIDPGYIDFQMTNWFDTPAVESKYTFMSDVLRLVANIITEKPVERFKVN